MMEIKRGYDKVFVDKIVEEADWEMISDAETTWTKVKISITWIGKDILGEFGIMVKKDTTWWNKEKERVLALGKYRIDENKN